MGFQVITTDDAGSLARDFRGISGARRAVADELLKDANSVLCTEDLWTTRTLPLMREQVSDLLERASAVLSYDGPTAVEVAGKKWEIRQDADAPAKRQQAKAQRTGKGPYWLGPRGARYENACSGGCGTRVLVGAPALYDAPRIYCLPCGEKILPRLAAA